MDDEQGRSPESRTALQRASRSEEYRTRLQRAFDEAGGEGPVIEAFNSHERRQRDARDAAVALTPLRLPPALPDTQEKPARAAPERREAGEHRGFLLPRRGWAVAGAVTLLAIGAAAGFGVGRSGERVGADPGSSATSTPGYTQVQSIVSEALTRAQVPPDALPDGFRTDIDPSSSRLLYDDDPRLAPTASRWRLWVGFGENPRQVCYLVTFDNVADAMSCSSSERALTDRIVVVENTRKARFEALIVGGVVAVQIS